MMRQQGILRALGGGVLALVLVATAGTWATPASADTKRVKDIYPGGTGSDPSSLVRLGDWLLFAATDPVKGRELWKTKGTPKTTKRIKDIYPGSDSSNPGWLTKVGGYVYFAATDPERGRELWRTKGTANTTKRVKDIRPGPAGSDPRLLTKGSSTLGLFCFFVADDGVHGTELWRTYAYRNRKEMLEINEHPGHNDGDADPHELTYFGGLMWLGATRESTHLYHGTQKMERGLYPRGLTGIRKKLFLTALDNDYSGDETRELWKVSDAAGPSRKLSKVIDIVPGEFGGSDPRQLTKVSGVLYFNADDGIDGREPWRSEGNATNTYRIKDINAGAGSSNPVGFTELGKKVFFSADDGVGGRELWTSKGRSAWRLKDIQPGPLGSTPRHLTKVGERIFFAADDGKKGSELWKTKGWTSNTSRVKDINAGAGSSNPKDLLRFGQWLYFVADDGKSGAELWRWVP